MTKEEMLAKVSAKTKEYNTEKEDTQKSTASHTKALVDKIKASLPGLKDTYEILTALQKDPIAWERFRNSSVPSADNMDALKDEDDGFIGMNTRDHEFGLFYGYREGSPAPKLKLGKFCINFVKEEIRLWYDGSLSRIPINEVSIDAMLYHFDLYHHPVLREKFEKLINAIDPYVETVTQSVESH